MDRLERLFYQRDVLEVAPALLRKVVVVRQNSKAKSQKHNSKVESEGGKVAKGIITEVEAYRGEEDMACHARFGKTERTRVMYGEAGHIYVYLIYGMYWMLNVVTGSVDEPQAVLLRGVWLVKSQNSKAKGQKHTGKGKSEITTITELQNDHVERGLQGWELGEHLDGPGKLTRELGIDGSFYGENIVTSNRLRIEDADLDDGLRITDDRVKITKRIGVEYAGEWASKKWRWVIKP